MLDRYLNHLQEKYDYNIEDLESHDAVSAIIYDNQKRILMLDHTKFNFWSMPMGKVKAGQTVEAGLKEELFEELGIKILKYKEIKKFTKTYSRRGRMVRVVAHMFEIEKYSGKIRNKEPHKHRQIKFMTLKEIKRQQALSDNAKLMIKILEK